MGFGSSISSVQAVNDIVKRDTGNFDFAGVIGSFVNNGQFAEGFRLYQNGNGNSSAGSIWSTLSAIGQDAGEALYSAIAHYIDDVSNSDTCKLRTLKSMLHQLGFEYTVFDQYKFMPEELQRAVDLMSISPSQLLRNDFMKADFVSALCADGVINPYSTIDELLKFHDEICPDGDVDLSSQKLYKEYISSQISSSLSTFTYDENQFAKYITGIYQTLISGFLTMSYNDEAGTPVYMSLNEYDGYFVGDEMNKPEDDEESPRSGYRQFKLENSIDVAFDPIQIADNIDSGSDKLDNYSGAQLSLLQTELDYRNANLYDFLDASQRYKLLTGYKASDMPVTRGSYYRKQKMLEYAKFVDLKWYMQQSYISSAIEYSYDHNYYDIQHDLSSRKNVVNSQTGVLSNDFNWNMVSYISKALTRMTMFIQRLREMMRLQTRKNYMKGTAGLLRFVVNELLVEYSRYNERLLNETGDVDPNLRSIYSALSSHSVDDVQVEEYWDKTEYFNIKTETSEMSENGDYVNPRYFEDIDDNPGMYLLPEDIDRFYLDYLNLRYQIGMEGLSGNSQNATSSDLHEFLETMFGLGADTSFINGTDGRFDAMLSSGNYSYQDVQDFQDLAKIYAFTLSCMNMFNYSFNDQFNIGDQIDDYFDKIRGTISDDYYDGIYDLSTQMRPVIDNYYTQIDSYTSNISNIWTGDYGFYFEQHLNTNCYDNGNYKYDYFINNSIYQSNNDSLVEQIQQVRNYIYDDDPTYNIRYIGDITGNIHNWPLLEDLNSQYINYYAQKRYIESFQQKVSDCPDYSNTPLLDNRYSDLYNILNSRINSLASQIAGSQYDTSGIRSDLDAQRNAVDALNLQVDADIDSSVPEKKCNSSYYFSKLHDNAIDDTKYRYEEIPHGTTYFKLMGRKVEYYWFLTKVSNNEIYLEPFFYENGTQVRDDEKRWYKRSVFEDPTMQSISNKTKWEKSGYYSFIDEGSNRLYYRKNIEDFPSSDKERELLQKINDLNVIAQEYASLAKIPDNALAASTVAGYLATYNTIARTIKTKAKTLQDNCDLSDCENLTEFNKIVNGTTTKTLTERIDIVESVLDNAKSRSSGLDTEKNGYETLLNQLLNLSTNYLVDKAKYASFSKSDDYSNYLGSYTIGEQFIPLNMNSLCAQIFSIDSAAETVLKQMLDEYVSDYDDLFTKIKNELFSTLFYRGGKVYKEFGDLTNAEYAEQLLQNFEDCLEIDLKYKLQDADNYIQEQLNVIEDYVTRSYDIISRRYLDVDDAVYDDYKCVKDLSGGTYDALLLGLCSKLNFYTQEQYIAAENTWPQYTGLSSSDDPYYNLKNKTHPSIQVHPFLWKFVKYNAHTQALIEKAYIGAYSAELNQGVISKNIDGYIGEFGQVIDKWRGSDQGDFTGYTTRYESEDNIPDDYTNGASQCEVVDYDGCFYPPALEMFLADEQTCINDLRSSKHAEDGFYDRYYSHLALSKAALTREADMLEAYASRIEDVAADHTAAEVYDIYKYALDKYGNSYILYKQYGKSDPTWWEKRDTPGVVWMREKDHPIGFPIFMRDAANVFKYSPLAVSNEFLNSIFCNYCINKNTDKLVYEFEMDSSQDAMLLAAVNCYTDSETDEPYRGSYLDKRCNCCNMCIVVPLELNRTVCDDGTIEIGADVGTDILALNENYIQAQSGQTPRHYTYVGMYTSNDSAYQYYTKVAFIERTDGTVSDDGTVTGVYIPDNPHVKVVTYYNRKWLQEGVDSSAVCQLVGLKDVCLDQAAFTFYNDSVYGPCLDLAFVSSAKTGVLTTDYSGLSVDPVADSSGAAVGDPQYTQVNSYDTFNQNVVVATISVRKSGSIGLATKQFFTGNMNADMSYMPIYPGIDRSIDASDKFDDGKFHQFELLGQSVDSNALSAAVAIVNTDPDPYIDVSEVEEDGCFGRVYEDWDVNSDTTLFWYSCEEMNLNNGYFIGYENAFIWTEDLTQNLKNAQLREDSVKDMTLMVFNMNSYGQSPYLVCSLSALIQKGSMPGSYDMTDQSDASFYVSSASTPGGTIRVVGTGLSGYNVQRPSSNNIFNVGGVTISVDYQASDGIVNKCSITVKFNIINPLQPCYIEKDEVKIVAVNSKDLYRFKFYHYLDQNGIVYQSKNGPYIIASDGSKMNLADIDFTQYDSLTSIAALVGDECLDFKISEEEKNSVETMLWYDSQIGQAYPMTRAQYYLLNGWQDTNGAQADELSGLFSARSMFMIDPFPVGRLADIGPIDIPVTAGENEDCRVFEDFIYNDDPQPPWKKYCLENVEFYKYVHFFADGMPQCFRVDPDEDVDRPFQISVDNQIQRMSGSEFINKINDIVKTHFIQDQEGQQVNVTLSAMDGEGGSGGYTAFDSRDTVVLTEDETRAVEDYAKIYAFYDYDQDADGVVLYFNYMNYLRSPFLRVENGRTYIDTIDSTYLKLLPGQNGRLDILVQFQRFYAKQLVGVRNICIASYQIYNVSDDKPKFMIKRVFECDTADRQEERPLYDLIITPEKADISSVSNTTYSISFIYNVENTGVTQTVVSILANDIVKLADSEKIEAAGDDFTQVERMSDNQCRISTQRSCNIVLPLIMDTSKANNSSNKHIKFPIYADIEKSNIQNAQIHANIGYIEIN